MNQLFTLSLALCAGIAAHAQTIHPAGVPGCIARYDMNSAGGTISTLFDVSGNNNHSSMVTDITPGSDFRGMPNKSMAFNGINSLARVPSSASLNTNDEITMIGVVYVNAYYSGLCQGTSILDKGKEDNYPGAYYMRYTDNRSDGNDCFAFDPTKQQIEGGFGSARYNGVAVAYQPMYEWFFVAISYNGFRASVYQLPMLAGKKWDNIAPIANYLASGAIGTNNNDLVIGMHDRASNPYWFNGFMDDVSIFNRGLDNDEMYKIYSYLWGATTSADGTAALQPLSLYPNPANSSITLQGAIGNGNILVQVYNAVGQVVATETVTNNNGNLQHTINTAGLPAGAYMAKVSNNGSNQSIHFSVQH